MTGRILRGLLPEGPKPAQTVSGGRLRFLGTAGFELVSDAGEVVVLDPFLTRPGLLRSVFGRIPANTQLLAREFSAVDAVLCGHSHHDHALDAPALCQQTGATLVGSAATANLARAAGLSQGQVVVVEQAAAADSSPQAALGAVEFGSVVASALPSAHGKAIFGRVPLPGDITEPPPWPPRMWDMKHGQVLLWHLDLGDVRVLHVDTAEWFPESLHDVSVDILLLCAVGRQYRQDYTRGIIEAVNPKVVIPCHWDDFTIPWGAAPRQLPGVKVSDFCAEITAAGAEPVVVGLGNRWSW